MLLFFVLFSRCLVWSAIYTKECPHWTCQYRWTGVSSPLHLLDSTTNKDAIEHLLRKHRGQKDFLRLLDQEYGEMVHTALLLTPVVRSTQPPGCTLSHTDNASSALKTSQVWVLETQQLWQSLTGGSATNHCAGGDLRTGRSSSSSSSETYSTVCSVDIRSQSAEGHCGATAASTAGAEEEAGEGKHNPSHAMYLVLSSLLPNGHR